MDYILRVGTPGDAPAVREIYDYYVRETTATFSTETASVESYRALLAETLTLYPFYLAETTDGRALGFVYGERLRPHDAYLWDVEATIYLAPDAPRRAGIGSALYRRFIDTLRAQGFCNVFGVITDRNEPSLALHRALGFTEVGHFRRMGFKHGQWLGIVWMELELRGGEDAPKPPIPFDRWLAGNEANE